MSEAKFSKGPWRVTERSGRLHKHAIFGDGIEWIADIADEPICIGGKQRYEANAKLIAVAPEMYAKLDKIAAWLEGNAKLRRLHAETSGQFKSLADEYLREAKNYEATAKDVRELLAKAAH